MKILKINFRIPTPSLHSSGEEKAEYWQKKAAVDFAIKKHEKNVVKKMELVMQVRQLKEKGYSQQAIAIEKGISHTTIRKYLSPNFNPVNGTIV